MIPTVKRRNIWAVRYDYVIAFDLTLGSYKQISYSKVPQRGFEKYLHISNGFHGYEQSSRAKMETRSWSIAKQIDDRGITNLNWVCSMRLC